MIKHVKQFKDAVDVVADEVCCDGGTSVNSHKIPSSLSAYCPESDDWFDIVEVEASIMPGCGCWHGMRLILKKNTD